MGIKMGIKMGNLGGNEDLMGLLKVGKKWDLGG